MGFFEPEFFIKSVRIFARVMRRQLNDVSTALICAFDCPLHHFASNPQVLVFPVYAHRLDLGTQSTLITNGRQEYQMKRSDRFSIQLCYDQFVIWITVYLFESRIIGFG